MSEDILFEAMGGIDGEYVLSAARRLGLLAPVGKKPRRALRRTLIGLAAAAALLVLGTLTAMAVSEPVRDALLGFFGVEYSEDAPYASPVGSAQGAPVRTGTEELGDGVTASYFVAPESDTVPRYGFSLAARACGSRTAAASCSWRRGALTRCSPCRARRCA